MWARTIVAKEHSTRGPRSFVVHKEGKDSWPPDPDLVNWPVKWGAGLRLSVTFVEDWHVECAV